jgi:hypothetical protein
MAIDLKAMRAKLSQLNSKGSSSSGPKFWKIPDGESVIRVLPVKDGDPFKEFHFHYNVGKENGFLCPKKNFGEKCAVCDFVAKLYKEGDDESRSMAKNFSSRQRFVTPIIVRGEEKEGIKLWSYSKKAYESLLQLVLNPDYGDISDEKDGIDLVITYGKAPGVLFPATNVTPRRKSSPLTSDRDLTQELLETEIDYTSIFERKTPEQVAQVLDRFLLGDDKEEIEKGGSKTASEEDDIDRKFSEMLG